MSFPRTADKYMGAEFLKLWGLCLSSFFFIYLLIDFIEKSSQIFKKNPRLLAVGLYYLYKSPMILFQMVPVAVLLGTLLVLVIFSKNSELTALKAGGISVTRTIAPILVLSSMISGGAFLINEYIVPEANQKAYYIYKVDIKKQEWRAKYRKRDFWYRSDGAIYRFDLFVPEQEKMRGVGIYRLDDQFHLVERIEAESAEYQDGAWYFLNGARWIFSDGKLGNTQVFERTKVPIPETPDDLKIWQKLPEQMSFRELTEYIKKLDAEGYDTTKYRVERHGKVGFALVSVIMVLLAVPFAATHGRAGGIALGIGIGFVIAVVYWIALSLSLAMGHGGWFPPVVAAWAPHVVFGALAIYLNWRMPQ